MGHNVTVSLVDEMRFTLSTGSGHEITIDASPAVGGHDAGPRPMELVLAGLAGCGSMDVISILRKMRQRVTGYEVTARGETAEEHPRRYVQIDVVHRITGDGVAEANVRRAIYLSMSRYCPVFAMLSPTLPIAVRYELLDRAGELRAAGAVTLDEPPASTRESA
jgi:putative redox protein